VKTRTPRKLRPSARVSQDSRMAGNKGNHKPQQVQSLNSDAAVPMLHFGVANNFDLFKRKVFIACMEKYKNLGRLIMDKKYYVPEAVDVALYDLTIDPFDMEKGRLRETHKRHDKEIWHEDW
jgi:hypothetical protein